MTSTQNVRIPTDGAADGAVAASSRRRSLARTLGVVWSNGWGRLGESAFLADFAGDLPHDEARVLSAVQGPIADTLFAGRTTHAAWRDKPSWYAVSTDDRTIDPDLERFMAKRMGATTIELASSHVSLLSHPAEVAALILDAAGRPA